MTIDNLVSLFQSLISHLYTEETTRSVSFGTSSEVLLIINEVLYIISVHILYNESLNHEDTKVK